MLEWGRKSGGIVPILLDGDEVARVDPEFWREGAELTIGGETWHFGRDGRDRVASIGADPTVRLRATRKSFFSSAWLVEGDGVTYEISPQFMSSTLRVQRDGQPIGTAPKAGFFGARAALEVDPSVPPMHQLFLLWISHIIRARSAAAAAQSPM